MNAAPMTHPRLYALALRRLVNVSRDACGPPVDLAFELVADLIADGLLVCWRGGTGDGCVAQAGESAEHTGGTVR